MARSQTGNRVRADGRRQLLVYFDPELIKGLKRVALDEDVHVYEIVEQAAREWLERHSGATRDKGSTS